MDAVNFDLATTSVTEVNGYLHQHKEALCGRQVTITHPDGAHNIAVGLDLDCEVRIEGHAGYYAGGMNRRAAITIDGSAGTGVAENMMSGRVEVKDFASNGAGASAHGGLLVVHGSAGLRCGISLKGGDIVIGQSVGAFSGFMAQAGRMVICGDAGKALGDSLYEAVIYIQGAIASLGADARLEPMDATDVLAVRTLRTQAGPTFARHDPGAFRKVTSARTLYHWNQNAPQDY